VSKSGRSGFLSVFKSAKLHMMNDKKDDDNIDKEVTSDKPNCSTPTSDIPTSDTPYEATDVSDNVVAVPT
jgi:hypothetical protein